MNYLTFFPYRQFRTSQEKIIKQIEESLAKEKIVLLSAPNGTGKTIIALCTALPIALENDLKIIYLCRTHAQNARVIKELQKIYSFLEKFEDPNIINGLSIRGRNEMCLNETLLSLKLNPQEAMAVCTDLRKNKNCRYFLNLLKKRGNVDTPILIEPEIFNKPVEADELITICKEKKICPYFLSKFLLKEMKIIICNYQWIFNPFIRDSFLQFIERELKDCILILDECHNIIDVATEINSLKLTPYSLKQCQKDLQSYQGPYTIRRFVNFLLDLFNKRKAVLKKAEEPINPKKLLNNIITKLGFENLNNFKLFLEDLLEYGLAIHEEKLANGIFARDYLGNLANFWLKWLETWDMDSYFFCYTINQKKDKKYIALEIVALEPREISIPILKNCHSCLNLSGTVNPYVYNHLMGLNRCGKDYKAIIAESPFKKENIRVLIIEGVSTRKEDRKPRMFKKMINKIEEVIACTPANVGVFCASYKILQALLHFGLERSIMQYDKKLFVESPNFSATENSLMIEDFKSMAKVKDGRGGVLLGVCGGRNSEGEDFPGEYMNSVVIAGFPYHLPTPRLQAKITYYDKVFDKQGWNFAYLYPAVQRANQAAGRPIRKVDDKGAIIFLDERFRDKSKWISNWLRTELELVPDKDNAIYQILYPFWHSQ
ncbi:MAG: helicase C-terminal domain-containing protein [Promethearchaeota archaeon]